MIKRLTLAAAATAAVAVPLAAAPSGASANPLPQCVQNLIANGPGFVLHIVETGELPRIMGPFC